MKRVLEREAPQRAWPASSTMGALLAREGLVVARKKRRRARSGGAHRLTRNRLREPMRRTACGARISKAGFRPEMASASIR